MANNQQPTVRLSFGPATRPPQATPTPPSPPSDSYYVFAENRSFGPVPSATIRQWIAEKRISGETLAQRAGTTDWKRIAGMPEFAGQVSPPTPSSVNPSSDSYYVFVMNGSTATQHGPASTATIRQWIAEKRIPENVMVQQVGTSVMKRIDELTASSAGQAALNLVPTAKVNPQVNQVSGNPQHVITSPATATPTSTPVTDSYYVRTENHQFGPALSVTIRQWLAENRISSNTLVQRTGTNDWKRIAELPEFSTEQVTPQSASIADEGRYVCEVLGSGFNNFLIAQAKLSNLSSSIMDQAAANPAMFSSVLIDNLSEFIVVHDEFTCAYEALKDITPPVSLISLHKEIMKVKQQCLAWAEATKEFMLLGAKNQIQEAQIQCVNCSVLSTELGISLRKAQRMSQETMGRYQKMMAELQQSHGK